jgi:flagella synthesis protein FlgN
MNMDRASPEKSTRFAQSLELSIQLMQQLETAMLEETRAIETRDADSLQRIVDHKRDLVARIEAETCQQKHWVELEQQPFTAAGMTKFFATLGNDRQLLALWSNLRESSVRCHRMNRSNAQLIDRDRKRITTLLRIMSGDDGASATYTPHGRTESAGPRSRTIIQA